MLPLTVKFSTFKAPRNSTGPLRHIHDNLETMESEGRTHTAQSTAYISRNFSKACLILVISRLSLENYLVSSLEHYLV